MTNGDWMDLAVLERRKYNFLCQVMDLSKQIGETLDRNDTVSLRMLVAMRQEPIEALDELKRTIRLRRSEFSLEEQTHIQNLALGESPNSDSERAYAQQASLARRELDRVLELDQRINLRMAGTNSYYKH